MINTPAATEIMPKSGTSRVEHTAMPIAPPSTSAAYRDACEVVVRVTNWAPVRTPIPVWNR